MNLSRFIFICTAIFLFHSAMAAQDKAGATDSTLLGRIPDSFIKNKYLSDYDEIILPLSANTKAKPEVFERLEISGQQELIIYEVPKEVSNSVPRIFKSIQEAAEKNKIKTLFTCRSWQDECGDSMTRQFITKSRSKASSNVYFYGLDNSHHYSKGAAEFAFYVGETQIDNRKVYLLAIAGLSKWSSQVSYSYEIITSGELEAFQLTEAYIASSIESEGKAILTGLYFENNKAALTDASKTALTSIAAFLKSNPGKYLVVGHTDYNGSYVDNQILSESRAKSVVQELAKKYEIDAAHLKAVGVSFASPSTSNISEKGREQNRRVELIPVKNF
jgi:OOP family OmpA-OmpF porin